MDDKRELASSIGQVEKPEGSSINRGLWAVCLLAWDTFHSLVKSFWNGALSSQQSVQRYKNISMVTCTDKYQ